MPLRQFLYCDDNLVDDFLAQLEGGSVLRVHRDERSPEPGLTQPEERDERPFNPLAPTGSLPGSSTRTSAVVEQVRASKVQRLFELLGPSLLDLDDIDPDHRPKLRRGDMVLLDAHVSFSIFTKLLSSNNGLAGILETMRIISPESIDLKTESAIQGISLLASTVDPGHSSLTAQLNPIALPEENWVCKLRESALLVESAGLEGEASILAKVARNIKPNESVPSFDIPGLDALPQAFRPATLGAEGGADVIKGPGVLVVPVAVYR